MFKSKHSGWTWDLKRTPFGPGGGGGFFESIGNAVSGLDPHITEGTSDWMAENGWIIPAAVVAWVAPEIIGAAGAGGEAAVAGAGGLEGGGAFIPSAGSGASFGIESGATYGTTYGAGATSAGYTTASEIGSEAFQQAITNGATQAEAQAAGDAAYNSYMSNASQYVEAGGNPSNFTKEMVEYANASKDPIGTLSKIAELTPEEFSSYTKIIGDAGSASGFTAGEDLAQLMKSYPDLSQAQLQDILQINYGADPMLSADAANLAKNGYDAATIDQVLSYSYNPTELAGTGIESNALNTASSSGLSDTLKNINRARSIAKLLSQDTSKIQYKNMPTAQQWTQNAQQVALNQPAQEQFGGLYQMNKNPFTFQNPLASALANKPATGLDVSGTSGQALNTQNQNQIYSSLLRS
jgi:hypothetical protein